MRFQKTAIALLCGFTFTTGANAEYIGIDNASNPDSFQVDDGRGEHENGKNDYLDETGALLNHGDLVQTGTKVTSKSADKFKLTFTYLFSDAGAENSFSYNGNEVFNNESDDYADKPSKSFIYNAGEDKDLDFFFHSEFYNDTKTIHNSNNEGDTVPGFFTFELGEDSYLLGFDDDGVADDNHDDMVIQVTASKVPEPGTLALLGLGLAGLGIGYRRRS